MERVCRGTAAGWSRSVSCAVRSTPLTLVIALEGSSGIEWEPRQFSTPHFASRRRQLHALRRVDDQGVLHGSPGRYWSNRHHGFALHQLWRSHRSGHSSEPSKEPRPAGRGFCKPRGSLSPLRYELPFIPALPSGASWQMLVNPTADLVHVAKQRKYAQRVDQGKSDGQDRNGH